jgi:uncharacterized RDD family membrane protein YckC
MQCPQCNTLNMNTANFCATCGSNLSGATTAPIVYKAYSGFWKRFGAMIIDSILLSIVGGICFTIGFLMLGGAMVFSGLFHGFQHNLGSALYAIGIIFSIFLLSTVVNWLYYTLMESSSHQATVGKMALGMVVIDEFGGRISFARANGRYWSKILSGMFFWIGYIMAAFTEKKQALHDLIATTFVVDK